MLKLYGMASPNVVKVLIMLEETGLEYHTQRVDVFSGEAKEDWFEALNPNGKVPVLVDDPGDGESPTVLCESGAILIYLAEKSNSLLPSVGRERAHVLQWLMFQMAGVGPMFGQAIHFRFATKDDGYGRRRFLNEMERLLEVIDSRLAKSRFLAGDAYSIADIAVFPWITTLGGFFPEPLAEAEHLGRWYGEIEARPAAERAQTTVRDWTRLDSASMKSATPEMLDRYFGRTERA
jgi:GSH-dependent disulfide-bond oxidoreductase